MRSTATALALALLGSGCGEGGSGPKPAAILPVEFPTGGPAGVTAWLRIEHHAGKTFDEVSSLRPGARFDAVSVEGDAFSRPADVYVVGLRLENGTSGPLRVPDLCLRPAGGSEGEPEHRLRPASTTLPPGARIELSYLWNPASPLAPQRARLDWPR